MSEKKSRKRDIAILGGPTQDGLGKHVVRVRDGQVSAGELRPAKEGQPLTQELVRLHPMDAEARVCSVEVLHAPGDAASAPTSDGADGSSHGGAEAQEHHDGASTRARPARVSNARYRENWDAIFDAKRKSTLN